MICRRHGSGPLITRDDVPDIADSSGGGLLDATSVFNPGAFSYQDSRYLLLRVQSRGRYTMLVPAEIRDQEIRICPVNTVFAGTRELAHPSTGYQLLHIYDPRITVIGPDVFVVTAIDTERGCRLAIWQAGAPGSDRFGGLEKLTLVSVLRGRDTRNGVLFPGKIAGRYSMLHRPNVAGDADNPASGNSIVLSFSDDLRHWDEGRPILSGRPARWDERIGSGPPPIRTTAGWLHLYHGIATHFQSVNIYQAGVVLLDLEDPARIVARSTDNILEPREIWEMVGQVPNVVFPSGWTVSKTESDGTVPMDADVHIYYGAADTCVGRADTTVEELIAAARR